MLTNETDEIVYTQAFSHVSTSMVSGLSTLVVMCRSMDVECTGTLSFKNFLIVYIIMQSCAQTQILINTIN